MTKMVALSFVAGLMCCGDGGDGQDLCTQMAQKEATCFEEAVDPDSVASCRRTISILRAEALVAAQCKVSLPCDYTEEQDEACWANVRPLPEHEAFTRACEACGEDGPISCYDGVESWKTEFVNRLTACFASGCGATMQACIAAELAPYGDSD